MRTRAVAESFDDLNYPGTDVLRNLPGIRGADDLAKFERAASTAAAVRLSLTEKQVMSEAGIRRIHGELFKDVYPWAGKYREVNIAKGDTSFLPSSRIGMGMDQVMRVANQEMGGGELKRVGRLATAYPEAAAGELAKKLAGPVAELNFVHPFREGNGRTTRAWIDQVARQAGMRLDVTRMDRDQWLEASRQSAADPDRTAGLEAVLRGSLVVQARQREAGRSPGKARERDRGAER